LEYVYYIQNQAPVYKKLGVIHYSNNSPANTYGEELHITTPKLEIPTIMWHKSTTKTLGVTLVTTGSSKLLTGDTKSLNIEYYDLADMNSGFVVGKVFNGLKIFVIEDQELLYAMSYKSNRSWTLPDFSISTAGDNPCSGITTAYVTTPTMFSPVEVLCNEVTLNWSSSVSSENRDIVYIIYRKDNVNDSWIILSDSLTGTTYTDSYLVDSRTYYYKVLGRDNINTLSDDSNIVSFDVSCTSQPTTPAMSAITLADDVCDDFYISWNASSSDDTPITYTLFRKDGTNDTWNELAIGLTATEYYDENLTNGETYYYKVIAYNNSDIPSAESNTVSRTVMCMGAPLMSFKSTAPLSTSKPEINESIDTDITENTMVLKAVEDDNINDVYIGFNAVDKYGSAIMAQDELLNNSITILMDWSATAKVTSPQNNSLNSYTSIEYSIDGGKKWTIEKVVLASAAAGGLTNENTEQGVLRIPNVKNINNIRVRIVPEFEVDRKSGGGYIAISQIISNNNNVYKKGYDRYIRNNLNRPTLDTIGAQKSVKLRTFSTSNRDGCEDVIKSTCVTYSQPMGYQDKYYIHLNGELTLNNKQIGCGSYASITILNNSKPIISACIADDYDYKSIDTAFEVKQGDVVEIYNHAHSRCNNLEGNVTSSVSISKVQEISGSGHYRADDINQSVCAYTG
jgi:hypothetical protein